jgi:hypothetical protein
MAGGMGIPLRREGVAPLQRSKREVKRRSLSGGDY